MADVGLWRSEKETLAFKIKAINNSNIYHEIYCHLYFSVQLWLSRMSRVESLELSNVSAKSAVAIFKIRSVTSHSPPVSGLQNNPTSSVHFIHPQNQDCFEVTDSSSFPSPPQFERYHTPSFDTK
jgi:hypothetical protein